MAIEVEKKLVLKRVPGDVDNAVDDSDVLHSQMDWNMYFKLER